MLKSVQTHIVIDYTSIIPIGTPVKIIRPIGEDDLGWLAVPMSFDVIDLPEDYELLDRYGLVTGYNDPNSPERNSDPIVVEKFIHLNMRLEHWEVSHVQTTG